MSNAIDAVKTVFAGLTRPGAQFELEEKTINGINYRAYKNAPATLTQISGKAWLLVSSHSWFTRISATPSRKLMRWPALSHF